MKQQILFATTVMAACSLLAAEPKDEVKAATKKLAEKANYSWKTTPDAGGGGGGGGGGGQRFRAGPSEGKTEKDGFTLLSMTRGESTTQAVLKGEKGAIKTDGGWKSFAEVTEGDADRQNPARFLARTLQSFKAPAAQADDLAGKTKEIKKEGDTYSGDLTEAAVKELLAFGGRRGGGGGGDGPAISNAKGSVKFWLKEGVLSKYEFKVQGTMSFGGNDRDINRTTTVEIKDVGSTKVEVPEEAKKKLS